MSDTLPRLAAALSRSYRLERELGQGGMATLTRLKSLLGTAWLAPRSRARIPTDRHVAAQVASRSDAVPSSGFSRVKGPR